MAPFTPYTYIQCPCHDANRQSRPSDEAATPISLESSSNDDDHTFDPRSPRSDYSLYPLEYLLFCDDCHQIRCPRCVSEEIVTFYCPNCLFEVASSSLKTEGNRCTRSCFQCPICIGPLVVTSLGSAPEPSLLSADNANAATPSGPYILTCSYCNWSSQEVGIKFDRPQGIFAQLSKLRNAETDKDNATGETSLPRKTNAAPDSAHARFSAMKSFYQSQLSEASGTTGSAPGVADFGYGSPGALSRIMSLYSGNSMPSLKTKSKSLVMREAEDASEGLHLTELDESAALAKLRREGWDGTVTTEQARAQVEEGLRFADQLWPIPYLLRTKRSKRCPVCRHIISKPEAKVGSTRWRIRLVAGNYIPSITIKPLNTTRGDAASSELLKPLQPAQFLVTFKNPVFDAMKVTLATPASTPGRFPSKVTVLCPQFTINANTDTDMYLEDVLKDGEKDGKKGDDASQQVEPGKVYERGRNWVSIVVEVIPASLRAQPTPALLKKEGVEDDLGPLKKDEDILEISVFVRLEWESEASQDPVGTPAGKEKDSKEKRELAYWCVFGMGRISNE